MSETKHTPGPWEIWTDDDGKSYSVVSLSMTTKNTICYIYGNRAQARKKIDARLIAAAPDLVEAVRNALSFYDGLDRLHDDGEALILDRLQAALSRALTEKNNG